MGPTDGRSRLEAAPGHEAVGVLVHDRELHPTGAEVTPRAVLDDHPQDPISAAGGKHATGCRGGGAAAREKNATGWEEKKHSGDTPPCQSISMG